MSVAPTPTAPGSTYGFRRCCEAVREAVPVKEIARRYTQIEPYGGKAWFMGRCPLPDHEDRTPSFYIYPPGRWWCYGCSRGGDVVDLEFFCGEYGEPWEAMISLAVEHDVELPRRPQRWHGWQGEKQRRRNMVRDAIANSYQRRLFKVYGGFLDDIADDDARREEARRFWRDLRPIAAAAADARVVGR